MFTKENSTTFVSTNNFKYADAPFNDLEKLKSCFILSLHTGFKHFDFTPIEKLMYKPLEYDQNLIQVVIQNNLDTQYKSPYMTHDQRIYTLNRGYVTVEKLNCLDVLLDIEGRYCKLVDKVEAPFTKETEMVCIDVSYNNNFICNNMLFKDNI